MNLLKLVMSKDQEYSIIDVIGQLEIAHFVDVNEEEEVFKLPYVDMLRRCEEAERKMLFVIKQCEKHDIMLTRVREVSKLAEIVKAQAEERKTVSSIRDKSTRESLLGGTWSIREDRERGKRPRAVRERSKRAGKDHARRDEPPN